MSHTGFCIGEWLVCPQCETICDAPFFPAESPSTEIEIHLGQSLPDSISVPLDRWQQLVAAKCPCCHLQLNAIATFQGHRLCEFKPSLSA